MIEQQKAFASLYNFFHVRSFVGKIHNDYIAPLNIWRWLLVSPWEKIHFIAKFFPDNISRTKTISAASMINT